jgi:hypothetical protein
MSEPTHTPDPPGQLGDELWRRLADAQDAALAAAAPVEELQRALAARIARPVPRRRARLFGASAGVAAVATAILLWPRPASLRFRLGAEGAEGAPGGTIEARADSELPLQFSDGSSVTFQPGSSGRVQRLTGAGAEVVLEGGRLEARVIHAAGTRWTVQAGPFRVQVTGTRFTVDWSAARQTIAVALQEGSVVVDGALLGAGVVLRAGQRLEVAAGSGLVRTEALGAPATAPLATAAAAAPAPETAPSPASPSRPAGAAVSAETPSSVIPPDPGRAAAADEWRVLAGRGAYGEALAAAERQGLGGLCRRLDARGLLALGDVARYAGAPAQARKVFESLASRFPTDPLAGDAVFSLGRLAFEAQRPAEAAGWFQRYVGAWPDGPLGLEAAGRLVECAQAAGDLASARRAARAYLARAPEGPQAPLAREVLAGAPDDPAEAR